MRADTEKRIVESASAAVASAAGTEKPRYRRADLMQKNVLTQSHFAYLLDLHPTTVVDKAKNETAGFLYAPIGRDPVSGDPRHAPWQVELVLSVIVGAASLEEARRTRELKLAEISAPGFADSFRLPRSGMRIGRK